jgi:hypothetical protein
MTDKNPVSKCPPPNYSPKTAFAGIASGACVWWDQTDQVLHTGTITGNTGTTLTVSAKSSTYTYDLTGDGTQCIPVSVPVTP